MYFPLHYISIINITLCELYYVNDVILHYISMIYVMSM